MDQLTSPITNTKSASSRRLGKRVNKRSYGGIIRYKTENNTEEYLLVKQRTMNVWSFPKGHGYELEPVLDTAKREIYEETGIQLTEKPSGQRRYKRGIYFLFDLKEKPSIYDIPDAKEIEEVKWVTMDEMKELNCNSGIRLFLEKNASVKVFS
jgi:8-oxo-dGTP pyrophosphatase MutT (NUDIX family)